MKTLIVLLMFSFLLSGCIIIDTLFPPKNKTNSGIENQSNATQKNINISDLNNSNISNQSIAEVQNSLPTNSIVINESSNLSDLEKNISQGVLKPKQAHDILEIYFFDVGFGDATLIRTKFSTILIGTGSEFSSAALVEKLRSLGVKKIDELILDSWLDTKIGGAKLILKRFPINRVWVSKEIPSLFKAQEVYSLIKQNNILIYNPVIGDKVNFQDLSLEVYNPQVKEYVNHPEANAIVLKIVYGNFCLFLPSDIEQEIEPVIVSNLDKSSCSLYKWRKNGEGRPTPSILFNNLAPKDVIISVGPTSKGEYPSKTTLTFLSIAKVGVYRTDIDKDIFVNVSKTGSYHISKKANLEVLGKWYSSTDASNQ
ncbi:MAG: hypothetical protein ACK4J0_01215 [Candidatus Anstonellaceae archaeon]